MFTKTSIEVASELFEQALTQIPHVDHKLALTQQTGEFLYDPWVIKDEYRDTVWDKLLQTLPGPIGEARLIVLAPGTGYQSHSDIDDRYHLNFAGDRYSYLLDLDNNIMYPVSQDRFWYNMNAGPRHSAVNLGSHNRIQLVVRKLLPKVSILDGVTVTVRPGITDVDKSFRFIFDDVLSPWLHSAARRGIIADFKFAELSVSFTVDRDAVAELQALNLGDFVIEGL